MFFATRIEIFVVTLVIRPCSVYTMNAMVVGRLFFPHVELLLARRNVQILGGWDFAPHVPLLIGISTPMGSDTRRARPLMDL